MAHQADSISKGPLLTRIYPRGRLPRLSARPRPRRYFSPFLQAPFAGSSEALLGMAKIEIHLPESHPLWAPMALTPFPLQRVLRRRRRL